MLECWAIIGTPFKWRFAGGSLVVRFLWYLGPHQLKKLLKKEPPEKKHIQAGHCRPASETPFKWHFTEGPMVAQDSMLAGLYYCVLAVPWVCL